jgi:hypothetical protein
VGNNGAVEAVTGWYLDSRYDDAGKVLKRTSTRAISGSGEISSRFTSALPAKSDLLWGKSRFRSHH